MRIKQLVWVGALAIPMASFAWAQTTTTTAPGTSNQSDQGTKDKDTDQGVKSDVREAGHATGRATKKTAHKTKRGVKKGTHKAAQKTRQGAEKVEDKTQTNSPQE